MTTENSGDTSSVSVTIYNNTSQEVKLDSWTSPNSHWYHQPPATIAANSSGNTDGGSNSINGTELDATYATVDGAATFDCQAVVPLLGENSVTCNTSASGYSADGEIGGGDLNVTASWTFEEAG